MTRLSVCRQCHTLIPPETPMEQRGVWRLCRACAALVHTMCAEGAHTWAGAVDDAGTHLWCCETCGMRLGHQALDERLVEASQETGWVDC